jgi:hypothetical protein
MSGSVGLWDHGGQTTTLTTTRAPLCLLARATLKNLVLPKLQNKQKKITIQRFSSKKIVLPGIIFLI